MGEGPTTATRRPVAAPRAAKPDDPTRPGGGAPQAPLSVLVLRVVRVDDGCSVYVKVIDRGPFGKRKRILDSSRSAAETPRDDASRGDADPLSRWWRVLDASRLRWTS